MKILFLALALLMCCGSANAGLFGYPNYQQQNSYYNSYQQQHLYHAGFGRIGVLPQPNNVRTKVRCPRCGQYH